jgi:hypothetical protein
MGMRWGQLQFERDLRCDRLIKLDNKVSVCNNCVYIHAPGDWNLLMARGQLQFERALGWGFLMKLDNKGSHCTEFIPKQATTSFRWVEAKCNSRSLCDKGATATTSPWVGADCTLRELCDPLKSATNSSLLLAAGVAFRSRWSLILRGKCRWYCGIILLLTICS